MHGLMMDTPLLISSIAEHAANFHGDREIVSVTMDNPRHRYTVRDSVQSNWPGHSTNWASNGVTASPRSPGTITVTSRFTTASAVRATSATRSIRDCFRSSSCSSSIMLRTAMSART